MAGPLHCIKKIELCTERTQTCIDHIDSVEILKYV